MSELSEKNRQAIFEKLNVGSVTVLATGGVHFRKAPSGTEFPFVVFDRVPKSVAYGFANNLLYETDWWSIKALTESDTDTGQQILAACENAINGTLNLSGAQSLYARRKMDMPSATETLIDKEIYHDGFYLEVYSAQN